MHTDTHIVMPMWHVKRATTQSWNEINTSLNLLVRVSLEVLPAHSTKDRLEEFHVQLGRAVATCMPGILKSFEIAKSDSEADHEHRQCLRVGRAAEVAEHIVALVHELDHGHALVARLSRNNIHECTSIHRHEQKGIYACINMLKCINMHAYMCMQA